MLVKTNVSEQRLFCSVSRDKIHYHAKISDLTCAKHFSCTHCGVYMGTTEGAALINYAGNWHSVVLEAIQLRTVLIPGRNP